MRDCEIKENDVGVLMNAETNEPFSYKDACVKLKPLVGMDPEATRASVETVTDFVKSTLKF
ncbi:hypothetical protein P3T33_004644 [Rhizobium sp. AN67]|nr:hypothetical protein [Rhizobium sp. AN67]